MPAFSVEGLEQLQKNIDLIGDKVALRTIKKASEKACEPLQRECKSQCPTDTGSLAVSIQI